MPRYRWFMCRMLLSVFSLKITLQSCLEQTCTKPQQTCCLSTADGNVPIMWNCWKPTWAIWKCEVCTNGMCFVSYPPVYSYHINSWNRDLVLSYSVLLVVVAWSFCVPSGCIRRRFCQNSVCVFLVFDIVASCPGLSTLSLMSMFSRALGLEWL